jgi:hypothetical protein
VKASRRFVIAVRLEVTWLNLHLSRVRLSFVRRWTQTRPVFSIKGYGTEASPQDIIDYSSLTIAQALRHIIMAFLLKAYLLYSGFYVLVCFRERDCGEYFDAPSSQLEWYNTG